MMEISKERIVDLFTIDGEDGGLLRNMVLGALISADNNTCRAEREHNMELLSQIRDILAEKPGTERHHKFCCEGIEILEKELRELADE